MINSAKAIDGRPATQARPTMGFAVLNLSYNSPPSLRFDPGPRHQVAHGGHFGRPSCAQLLGCACYDFEAGLARLLARMRVGESGTAFLDELSYDLRTRSGRREQRAERVGRDIRIR